MGPLGPLIRFAWQFLGLGFGVTLLTKQPHFMKPRGPERSLADFLQATEP